MLALVQDCGILSSRESTRSPLGFRMTARHPLSYIHKLSSSLKLRLLSGKYIGITKEKTVLLYFLHSFFPCFSLFLSPGRLQAMEQQQSACWLPKVELSQLPDWIRNWILFLFCYPFGPDPVSPLRVLREGCRLAVMESRQVVRWG